MFSGTYGDVIVWGGCALVFIIIALPTYLLGCDPTLMPLCPAYRTTTGYITAFANYDAGGNSDACSKDFYFGYAQIQLPDQSTCRLYVIPAKCDGDSATAQAQQQYKTTGQNMTVYIPKASDPYYPSRCYQRGFYTKDMAIVGITFFVLSAVCCLCLCANVVTNLSPGSASPPVAPPAPIKASPPAEGEQFMAVNA
jgi:hypothetical protein